MMKPNKIVGPGAAEACFASSMMRRRLNEVARSTQTLCGFSLLSWRLWLRNQLLRDPSATSTSRTLTIPSFQLSATHLGVQHNDGLFAAVASYVAVDNGPDRNLPTTAARNDAR